MISVAISIVFPIVFKNKNRILNTLALFTKIPLHDVDFYNNHYKLVMLNLTSIDDSCDLLKAIQKQAELNRCRLSRLIGKSFWPIDDDGNADTALVGRAFAVTIR